MLLTFAASSNAQTRKEQTPYLPKWAVKTNTIYWASATPNLAFEVGLAPKWTLDVQGGYNPFTFSEGKKTKHWLVQPEVRWWTCERFNGHFFGLHAHGGTFNMGGKELLPGAFKALKDNRYQGEYYGGGLSYGYHWILKRRWSIEAEIGVGYTHMRYDKYDCGNCGTWRGEEKKNFVSVTKAAVSLIYVIK